MENDFPASGVPASRGLRKVLITGGSKGIGKAVTLDLWIKGYDVYCLSRTSPNLFQERLHWCEADLAFPQSVTDVIGRLARQEVVFDALIVNAAVQDRENSQWTETAMCRHMTINCFSQVQLIERLCAMDMVSETATVISMTTKVVSIGSNWSVAYLMSKAALDTAMRCFQKVNPKWCINSISASRVNTPGNPKREVPANDPNPFFKEPCDVVPYVAYLMEQKWPMGVSGQLIDLGR